jgi:hypothetical protein
MLQARCGTRLREHSASQFFGRQEISLEIRASIAKSLEKPDEQGQNHECSERTSRIKSGHFRM